MSSAPELSIGSRVVSYPTLEDDLLRLKFDLTPSNGIITEYTTSTLLDRRNCRLLRNFITDWLPTQFEKPEVVRRQWRPGQIRQFYGSRHRVREIIPTGTILEVAGPTQGAESMPALYKLAPTYVTNIADQNEQGNVGPVDFKADARSLPFCDNSLSGVFISCLPGALRNRSSDLKTHTLRDDSMLEATRTLRAGGILMWIGGTQADFDFAKNACGLAPLHIEATTHYNWPLTKRQVPVPTLRINGAYIK